MKYSQFSHSCVCGQQIKSTYIRRLGYMVTCARCSRSYHGGFWIRTLLLGYFQNYEGYSNFRKVFNSWMKFIFTKLGLC